MNKLFTLLFLFFSTGSFATTYYVSSVGNDGNPGTSIAGAWATIDKVNSSVFLPGDTLYFEGGHSFNGSILLTATDANDPANIFVISSYGTGRAVINAGTSFGFEAHNTQGFSISNLIFDGGSAASNTAAGITVFSDLAGDIKFSNISISNIEVKNFGAEGVVLFTTKNLTGYQNVTLSNLSVHDVTKNGIKIFGFVSQALVGWQHKNVTVSNCEVYNVPGSGTTTLEGNGIVLEGVDGGIIQNSVAHDMGQNNSFCGGPAGIWTLESNNITIQFCESYRIHSGTGCDGAGFDLDGGVMNSVMQYNYAHNNDGAGFLMGQFQNARPWSNNTMRYNISENDGVTNEGGIGLFKGPGTTMSGANIYNNTVFISPQTGNSNISATYLQNLTTGINNVAFYNNIFITTGGVPFVEVPLGYSAFFAGNIYWSSGGSFSIGYQGNNYTSLASWRAATSNEMVSGNSTGFSSDPLLTNPGLGGTIGFGNNLNTLNAYKISNAASPANNAALDLAPLFSIDAGNRDFWGTILPGGNANSIGASQFSSTLPVVLVSFYGVCSGGENNLFWNTAQEINFRSFELMYSADEQRFVLMKEIRPTGNNSSYSFINDQASPGINYYQLKMTDLDGTVAYSNIVRLQCETLSDKIAVGPNPFNQTVNIFIESLNAGMANMTLYDAVGKTIAQKQAVLREGNNQFLFDGLAGLPAGAYYLQITKGDKTEHVKLIKSRN